MAHLDTLNLLTLSHSDSLSPAVSSSKQSPDTPQHFSNIGHTAANEVSSLDQVDAGTLPAKILVLLSKFAIAIKEHNGLVIQLNSLDVFKQAEQANQLCEDPLVQKLYRQLLVQTRSYIRLEEMYTVDQKLLLNALESNSPCIDSKNKLSVDATMKESTYNKASRAARQNQGTSCTELSVSTMNFSGLS